MRGLKIIQGSRGMFVAMPNRRRKDGTFQDIAHPINAETREMMESRIIAAYKEERQRGASSGRESNSGRQASGLTAFEESY